MKKILVFVLTATMLLSLSACGGNQLNQSALTPKPLGSETTVQNSDPSSAAPSETPPSTIEPSAPESPNSEPTNADEPQTNSGTNILVAYFSMPETTDPNSMTQDEDNSVVVIDGEVLGNTQYVAQLIQKNTGGDIFRIEPQTPYPTDHATLVDLADKEQKENARPELLARVENLDQYDVVFLGYPNWWADMPMVLYTFLETHDLSGKTIIPFNTHGGSGFSNTIRTIAQLQPNAAVAQNGFTVSRNTVDSCETDVIAWLKGLGIVA